MERRADTPGCRGLVETGELEKRVGLLKEIYRECKLCPHECGVDRTSGEKGVCRSGVLPVVASHTVLHGEEPPRSGERGSGTIFFTGCTGRCLFCQNYPISQLGAGSEITEDRLAGMMLELEDRGCHNINFVTPTHFAPSIAAAAGIAASRGLSVPIVYNTSGYERLEIIRLLDGIVDIYLPDAKYADDGAAENISGFRRYTEHNRSALKEMFAQVGTLVESDGIARRGLVIRHLILPGGLAGTAKVLPFIAEELSPDVQVSLMDQYFPAHKALAHPVLSRRITSDEYDEALVAFDRAGLHNGWIQDHAE